MSFANPHEHVPEVERNNHTIKERIRATYHMLPYQTLTKTMVKILAQESAKKLNVFLAHHGVSEFYSPWMILHQQILNYNKHCRCSFGSYSNFTIVPVLKAKKVTCLLPFLLLPILTTMPPPPYSISQLFSTSDDGDLSTTTNKTSNTSKSLPISTFRVKFDFKLTNKTPFVPSIVRKTILNRIVMRYHFKRSQ